MVHKAAIAAESDDVRRTIRTWLTEQAHWEVSFDTVSKDALLSEIAAAGPDVVFVSCDLPGIDPFDLVRRIPQSDVVLISAREREACRAFEAGALDFIVPPVEPRRLDNTLARFYRFHAPRDGSEARQRWPSRMVVWENSHGRILETSAIDWIDSVGNYVKIHANGESHYVRENIGVLAERLDPDHFQRIHRSTIVNVDQVRELLPASHGDLLVRLDCGETLKMSRFYRKRIDGVIGKL